MSEPEEKKPEERTPEQALEELDKAALIELLRRLKEERDEALAAREREKTVAAERQKEIIREFFGENNGSGKIPAEDDPDDLKYNKAFQELRKKIAGR